METYNEKHQDLKKYQNAIRERKRMEEGLEEYKATRLHPASPGTDGGNGGGGAETDMSDYFKKIEEKEEEIRIALLEEENIRQELIEKIDRIKNDKQKDIQNQKDVLFKLYICNKDIKNVAEEMKYSREGIYKIKKKAIKNYKI